ncbi:hypothetical protein JHD50_09985 [Sulfurimonas sp. MAG313]|nr:hypothetical protein [Sulfurimonas sp. MAG313]
MYKKLLISALLISLVSFSFLKPVDDFSSVQLDKAFARSITVFAIVRTLNGLISVLQGTEVYATPAGVGVNFAVGQILDPMNDILERFSWIMLMSSVSLGIQELMLNLGQTQLIQGFLALSALGLLMSLWIPPLWHKKGFNLVFKTFIIFSFLRFFVPLSILLTEGIYTYGLHTQYEEAKSSLELSQRQTENIIHKINTSQNQYKTSWLESLNLNQQIQSFKLKMQVLWNDLKLKFNHAIEYMLTLIAIFIVQSVLFPLLFLWIAMKLFKWLAHINMADSLKLSQV